MDHEDSDNDVDYDKTISELESNFYDAIYELKKYPEYWEYSMDKVSRPLLDSILKWYQKYNPPPLSPRSSASSETSTKESASQGLSYADRLKRNV